MATPHSAQRKIAPLPADRRSWRFLQLTFFIAAWMLLSPIMQDRWIVQLLLQLFLVNSVLVTLSANDGWRAFRGPMLGLWLLSLAGSLLSMMPLAPDWQLRVRTVELASQIPLLALIAVGILKFVFRSRRLTVDSLFATIVVYLLMAMLFALVFLLVLVWDPSAFDLPVAVAERTPQMLHSDMLYFSLITLATVGYGDILPLSELARMLAVTEAVVGQFYVAVIVAAFVGMFAAQRQE